MTASLDSLTQNLIKSGKDKFRHTKAEFGDSDLVFRKGVYCYEYMKGPEQFLESKLPPRGAFYSQLNEHELSADDYKVAEETWNTFECKTLKDYHDFYLKLDVTLLADIFENFRAVARSTYGLDPAHYWSLPGYSWDACLKQTKVELELLTEKDAQMYLFIESAIRGGVSMIAHRHAVANNGVASQSLRPIWPTGMPTTSTAGPCRNRFQQEGFGGWMR